MWLPKSISHKEDKDSNYFYESDYLSLIKDNDHKPIVVKAIKKKKKKKSWIDLEKLFPK